MAKTASAMGPSIKIKPPGPKAAKVLAKDAQVVSPSYTRAYPLVVDRGDGVWIYDVDGNRYLDMTSGVGVTVAANKFPGIRAGMCHDSFSARQGREDDNTNVLCLGARVIGEQLALDIVRIWLDASFSGAERHVRRLGKVEALEKRLGQRHTPMGSDLC